MAVAKQGPSISSSGKLGSREENLRRPARPMLANDKWNIPANSIVRMKTVEGVSIIGNCYKNPIHTASSNAIELVNCWMYVPDTKKKLHKSIMKIFQQDITEMSIEDPPDNFDPTRHIPERLISTKIISTTEDLNTMIEVFKSQDVRIVAISFQGINVGRLGTLGWICLITRHNLLINIDTIGREKDANFWSILDREIFSNDKIMKVTHNLRPIVDYVFHRKCIRVVNVFDTQLAELYIRTQLNRDKMPRDVEGTRKPGSEYNWEMYPLSKCLQKFLPRMVPPFEIPLLQEFEKHDFGKVNSLNNRPFDCKEGWTKCVAISMKYLLELHDAQMNFLMTHYNQCIREQMIIIMRGNMADFHKQITDPTQVAQNVAEVVIESPSISIINDEPI